MGVRSTTRLSQSVAKAALRTGERYHVWDQDLGGFGLRVEASGTKTFIVRYRPGGGRAAPRRFFKIGRYGVLTVEEARTAARIVLASVATGGDPAAERAESRAEITIAGLIELYAAEGSGHLKPLTRQYTLARLRNHVLPLIGSKKVSEVHVREIEQLIRTVTLGHRTARDEKLAPRKRVIVRGGEGAAAKVTRDLSAVLSFAVLRRLITSNPCSAVRKPAFKSRTRYLNQEELSRFGDALRRLDAVGENTKALAIIRLWALTGCRRNEIAGLRWDEVDLDRSRLVLADSKTGRSVRPLAPEAVHLLSSVERPRGSTFVFPAERGTSHFQGTRRVWNRVKELADLPDVTPHSLRHTMGSLAVSSGETLPMVGAILGHANHRSSAIYAHMQPHSSSQAVARLGGIISAALSPASIARQEHSLERSNVGG